MRIIKYFTLSLVFILLSSSLLISAPAEVDTSRVRDVQKIKKSTGEILADIPGEILKLPFYTIEYLTYIISTNPPMSEMVSFIEFGKEVKPYVPIVGYNTRAGVKFGFGLRKVKNIARGDQVKFKWYYSTNRYQSYMLRYKVAQFFSPNLGLDVYFRYKKRPRERFYGLGNESLKDKEANYTLENTEFKVSIPLKTYENVYFSIIGGYTASNICDGLDPQLEGNLSVIFADPDFDLADGRLDDSRYYTFGGSMEYDGRDCVGQPKKGTHFYAKFIKYFGTDISEGQDITEYNLDLRHYFHIWNKRVLALRAYLQRFDAYDDNTRATPIYITSRLGGIDALRGYSSGRFIDNDLAFVSAEYRYPIYDFIDAFVFLDEGRVFEKISDEKVFTNWKRSAGFGFRLWEPDDVTALFQVAVSDETTKFYLELGATW